MNPSSFLYKFSLLLSLVKMDLGSGGSMEGVRVEEGGREALVELK